MHCYFDKWCPQMVLALHCLLLPLIDLLLVNIHQRLFISHKNFLFLCKKIPVAISFYKKLVLPSV